jgi:polyhydroxyalkanoate synthesis regulator phasin
MGLLSVLGAAGLAYATGGLSALGIAAPATEAGALAAGTAGATLLGSDMQNQTAINLANQQQAFSAQQASTIYQRGAADLAAAGINPILAYGSPASMGSYVQPNIQPSLSLAAGAFNSAYDVGSRSNLQNTEAGDIIKQQPHKVALLHSEKLNKDAATNYVNASTVKTGEETKNVIQDTALKGAQTGATSAQHAKTIQDTLTSKAQELYHNMATRLKQHEITNTDAHTALMQMQSMVESAVKDGKVLDNVAKSILNDIQRQARTVGSAAAKAVIDHPDAMEFAKVLDAFSNLIPNVNINASGSSSTTTVRKGK